MQRVIYTGECGAILVRHNRMRERDGYDARVIRLLPPRMYWRQFDATVSDLTSVQAITEGTGLNLLASQVRLIWDSGYDSELYDSLEAAEESASYWSPDGRYDVIE